jgi:septal ring factor EnvC (AmiA/AmiB activator)
MHLFEIEDLRRALTQRESELERVETEKNRTSMEKNDFIKTVKALEADLVRVRKDAERFGNDLKALKKEKEKLEERRRIESERSERGEKQLKARMRILSEEIQGEREKWRTLNEQWRTHVCTAYVSSA